MNSTPKIIAHAWRVLLFLVEAGGFGPPKQRCNRFTVCPLWPLGNASSYKVSVTGNIPAFRQSKIYQKCGSPHNDIILCANALELVDGLEPPTC